MEEQPSPRQPGESEIDYLRRLKREGHRVDNAEREQFYESMRPRLRGYVEGEGARVAQLLGGLVGQAKSEPGAASSPYVQTPETTQVVRAHGKNGDDVYVHIKLQLAGTSTETVGYTMTVSGEYKTGSANVTSLRDKDLVIVVNGAPTINLDELRAQILRFAGLA